MLPLQVPQRVNSMVVSESTFHFNQPSQIGLGNVRHVLTGPIKSYGSPEDILEDANYWGHLPLNEQLVLEMNQPGLNYPVVAVQFANGTL